MKHPKSNKTLGWISKTQNKTQKNPKLLIIDLKNQQSKKNEKFTPKLGFEGKKGLVLGSLVMMGKKINL